ncbi:MAG: hypothetical protein ACM34K_18340 [Bacillota bacterium]
MEKILFVDDEKLPEWFDLPSDTPHAKTGVDTVRLWGTGKFEIMYLDYDLGFAKGDKLLEQICIKSISPGLIPLPKKIFCISLNQSGGVEKIKAVCKSFNIPFENIGQKMMFDKFTILGGQGG